MKRGVQGRWAAPGAWRVAALAVMLMLASPAQAVECTPHVFEDKRYTVCEVAVAREPLQLFLRDDEGQPFLHFDVLERWLGARGQRLRWAMNAGMYHPDMAPVGWLVTNAQGKVETVAPLNREGGRGNFFLLPNGVFLLSTRGAAVLSTEEAARWAQPVTLATQSGPLLVHHGQLHPALLPASNSRFVRNGVGVSASGSAWFTISDEPVNFHEFARFFRDHLQCADALYFDGNVSSLYDPALPRHDRHAVMGPILAVVERP